MEKLESLVERMLERCAASALGIIRMSNGEVVYLVNRSKLPDELVKLACAAAHEIFTGKLMKSMIEAVKAHRHLGDSAVSYLESVRFTFSGAYHWMTVIKNEYIVVITAPKMGVSPGYTETMFRSFLPRLGMLLK